MTVLVIFTTPGASRWYKSILLFSSSVSATADGAPAMKNTSSARLRIFVKRILHPSLP